MLSEHLSPREKKLRLIDVRDVCANEGSILSSAPDLQSLGLLAPIVPNRDALMGNVSRFETLTNRNVLVQERTKRFISDLRHLVQLLETNITIEEQRTGVFDPMNPNYSASARELWARRENLTATISRLEGTQSSRDVPSTRRKRSTT